MKKPDNFSPQQKLTRPIRRILMSFLIIAFFVISPIIILYTAGYRYDWQTRQLRQTGVLSVDIKPKTATVWLNDIKINKDIPLRLTNRAPGNYHLKLTQPGYKTWEKDIIISSNQTTYIKDITLIKASLPFEVSPTFENIQGIYGSPYSHNLLLLNKQQEILEILTFDLRNEQTASLLRLPSQQEPIISLSPFFDLAYILVQEKIGSTLYLLSLSNPQDLVSYKFSTPLPQLQWNKTIYSEPLFIKLNNQITRLTLTGVQTNLESSLSPVWYIDEENKLWTVDNNILKQGDITLPLQLDESITKIIDTNHDRLVLQTTNNTVIIKLDNKTEPEINLINGTNWYYQRNANEWWIWSPWELSSIYSDGGVNLLNRSGEKIQQVLLLDEDGVILLATNKGLKTFNPGYYVGHDLTNQSAKNVYVNLKQRELFFLSSPENKLYKLEF